ncbi:MAG: hypothetical protein ACKPKO_32840, partial [Candidatus Fonsibacter sp.]
MLSSFFFDEVWTTLNGLHYIQIYFIARLYDLFVGLPYEHMSYDGELNYRLRVMYNKNNLVPKQVLIPGTTANGDNVFKTVKFIQMSQEVSSIALWNPLRQSYLPYLSYPFRQCRRRC